MMKLFSMIFLVIIFASILAVVGMAQNMTTNQTINSSNSTGTNITANAVLNVTNGTEMKTNVTTNSTFVQGELLVKYNATSFVSAQAINDAQIMANAVIGASTVTDYTSQGIPGLLLVKLPPGMSVEKGIAYYSALPNVQYAEVNAVYTIANPADNQTVTPPPVQVPNSTAGKSPGNISGNFSSIPQPESLKKA